jgi:hypothetical protein
MQLFRYLFPSSLLTTSIMDTLPSPFSISINDKPVAKISDSDSSRTQAKVESGAEAAVFELKNGRLGCGGWMLGRNLTEDRSMLPKKVMWFKMAEEEERTVQKVEAEKEGDGYVLRFGGTCASRVLSYYLRPSILTAIREAID